MYYIWSDIILDLQNFSNAEKQEIVKKYFNTVYRLAFTRTKNKEFAEDVCQDVFLAYLKTDKQFESEEHIKAWLIRVTVNKSKSVFLSSWYRKSAPLHNDIVFESKEISDLFDIVQKLPEKYRTVIYLFYREDMSVMNIAKTLGIKENTVKSRLLRARDKLKIMLGERYDYEI